MNSTSTLIDPTDMRTIAMYLLNDKGIKGIVDVLEMDLAEIADLMLEEEKPKSEGQIKKMETLLIEGRIATYFMVEEIRIPLTNAVECIRLDPFYIVKDLKKKYQ